MPDYDNQNMKHISKADWAKLHLDFRGVWTNEEQPEHLGKRVWLTNEDGATVLLIEGEHFEIIDDTP